MRRLHAVTAAALIALTCWTSEAKAERYVVGVEAIDYLPYYAGAGKSYDGMARDLFDAYAADRGHVIDYRPLPITRLFRELLDGLVDAKFPDNDYWQADLKAGKAVVYSDPVFAYTDGVLVLPGNKGHGANAIRSLGTVRGFTAFEWLDRIKAGQVKLEENPSFPGLMFQAANKRIDGAYANVAVANYALEHDLKTPGALVLDPDLPHTSSSYRLSSVKHPEMITDFNGWLKEKPEVLSRIKKKWGVE